MSSREPRRSLHRDIYLDTADGALRRLGVTCRLRVGLDDAHLLSLRTSDGTAPIRVDSRVHAADVRGALAENTSVARRLRALVEPERLAAQLELEVQRITRAVSLDLLRRPRIELHFDRITVRRRDVARTFHHFCGHLRRGDPAELDRLSSAFRSQYELGEQVSDPREHAELLLRWARSDGREDALNGSDGAHHAPLVLANNAADLLNPELSLLAFQRRVLALAEDARTPLRERLRFLGIVSSNIDELYMVRMSSLRAALEDPADGHRITRGDDGLTPYERLALVEAAIAALLGAQSRCAAERLQDVERHGIRMVSWSDLDDDERDVLAARCRDEIHPALTPLAMTLSPGHPLPHLPHLGLSLAVVFRPQSGGRPHLAEFELPADVPRLIPVPGREGAVISIEALLRANVDLLHPNVQVEGAHLFRVTRAGDLAIDEDEAESLLVAVAEAAVRRPYNPAVRVEVERTMPTFVAELLLESLRRDAINQGMQPVVDEVQVIDGLLDLRCLVDLPLPVGEGFDYRPLRPRDVLSGAGSMLDAIRAGDVLVHHPFDAFDASVVRFLREAADDKDVTTIRITLYRVGEPSPVVAALLAAANAGKKIVAFVEVKARFEEEHNVSWARAIESAGGNVVYGIVGLKTHAKVALVVRREGGKLQRYAHVGTGNYNARAGRQYTDLSLFSAREDLVSDVADLFNELTGSARAPRGLANGALAAPHQLLPAMLALIAREVEHARAGRACGIAIKVNGLSDPEVVRALYAAADAGVPIELVVRGICTLRPDDSRPIRVMSVVGRFLEHSRIYRFSNDGAPEYFIGSSDLRPRNLRRRVELLVPVRDRSHQAELDRILALYLADGTAWDLQPDGTYIQRDGSSPSAQVAMDGITA